jgi:hypothetical protein
LRDQAIPKIKAAQYLYPYVDYQAAAAVDPWRALEFLGGSNTSLSAKQ